MSKSKSETIGEFIGGAFAWLVMSMLFLMLAAWPLMLWAAGVHKYASESFPAFSYAGSIMVSGFVWTSGVLIRRTSNLKA